MSALPEFYTPEQIAKHFGLPANSDRTIRNKARDLGVLTRIGKQSIILSCDIPAFMEALKCPSSSKKEDGSIITEAPLTVDAYAEVQKRLTKKEPNGSRRKSKRRHGNVVSMDRGRI